MNRRLAAGTTAIFLALLTIPFHALANLAPVANFVVLPGEDGSPSSVIFDASASLDADGTIETYQWLFGDGTTGSGETRAHIYPTVATYTVTLVVTDDQGASHIVNRTIDLRESLSAPGPAQPETRTVPTAANVAVGTYVGARAPDFTLPDLEDKMVSLSDFLGQVVLLEFWSSGCHACVSALPHLESLRLAYEDRGLVVIDVITNSNYWEAHQLLEDNGYTGFVTLRELDLTSKPTKTTYGVTRVPHAFLIDRTGVIRFTGHLSFLQEDTIEEWL
jgi:peroxiredoxin